MRHRQLILILLVFSISKVFSTEPDENLIRVMSYNIHYGVGHDNNEYDLKRIANVIISQNPDIVGLQEIKDSLMAAELGRLTNMNYIFGPSKEKMNEYGDAILSKYPVEWIRNYAIPSASSSRYQVMAVKVDLSKIFKDNIEVLFLNSHFDWLRTIGSEMARLATVDLIETAFSIEIAKYPSILTGDLNSVPESIVLNKLFNYGWYSVNKDNFFHTINSKNPVKQIDYILLRSNGKVNFNVRSAFTLYGEQASDHLPVIADIMLEY